MNHRSATHQPPRSVANEQAFHQAAKLVREALANRRSDRLLRLFDYLVACSLAHESPSEQQIAQEIFLNFAGVEDGGDTNVRVYVHRLRKIIDTVFAGVDGPMLRIPSREYRLVLVDADQIADADDDLEELPPPSLKDYFASHIRAVATVLALTLCASLIWIWKAQSKPSLEETAIWQSLHDSDRPLIIAVGDYYMFAKIDPAAAEQKQPTLIWDHEVPTREELIILQISDPDNADELVDYKQQFMSGGTIEALSQLRNILSSSTSLRNRDIDLVPSSQITPEMIGSSDIIYIGQLNGMSNLVRDALAQASGFDINYRFDQLTDRDSKSPYHSDGMILTDERISRRDYAYLANMPGPNGNCIIIVSGVGEASVKEALRIVSDVNLMRSLDWDSNRQDNGFEALYRVRTINNLNVGASHVLDRPLNSKGVWDDSGSPRIYRPLEKMPVLDQ